MAFRFLLVFKCLYVIQLSSFVVETHRISNTLLIFSIVLLVFCSHVCHFVCFSCLSVFSLTLFFRCLLLSIVTWALTCLTTCCFPRFACSSMFLSASYIILHLSVFLTDVQCNSPLSEPWYTASQILYAFLGISCCQYFAMFSIRWFEHRVTESGKAALRRLLASRAVGSFR